MINKELSFHSLDENLIIKGGFDLFTTKPVNTDKKLFNIIKKNLNNVNENSRVNKSFDDVKQKKLLSKFDLKTKVQNNDLHVKKQEIDNYKQFFNPNKENKIIFNKNYGSRSISQISLEKNETNNESPFGPLKNSSNRKIFAYLIAILNITYQDNDFSTLLPTTKNFCKINTIELFNNFNNLMLSLGKKEEFLGLIWQSINGHMNIFSSDVFIQNKNRNSHIKNQYQVNHVINQLNILKDCQVYKFQPFDESVIQDLNYPYKTMWSFHWFIYNKKKKKVGLIYLTALNKLQCLAASEKCFSSIPI